MKTYRYRYLLGFSLIAIDYFSILYLFSGYECCFLFYQCTIDFYCALSPFFFILVCTNFSSSALSFLFCKILNLHISFLCNCKFTSHQMINEYTIYYLLAELEEETCTIILFIKCYQHEREGVNL